MNQFISYGFVDPPGDFSGKHVFPELTFQLPLQEQNETSLQLKKELIDKIRKKQELTEERFFADSNPYDVSVNRREGFSRNDRAIASLWTILGITGDWQTLNETDIINRRQEFHYFSPWHQKLTQKVLRESCARSLGTLPVVAQKTKETLAQWKNSSPSNSALLQNAILYNHELRNLLNRCILEFTELE